MSALSRLSSVPQSRISRIEAGNGAHFATVAKLAGALNLSLDSIAEQCGFRSAVAQRKSLVEASKPLAAMLEELTARMDEVGKSAREVIRYSRRRER